MADEMKQPVELPDNTPESGRRRFARREKTVLLLTVGFQLIVLSVMIAGQCQTLVRGQTVVLRTVPVDPRDMFRGDYVILNYDFSRVPPGGISGLPLGGTRSHELEGQIVYVSLVPEADGVHWRADKFTAKPPSEGTFLKGKVGRYSQIHYGIESFYVQEGTGHKYEDASRLDKLSAEVAVGPSGRATLRRLRIEP